MYVALYKHGFTLLYIYPKVLSVYTAGLCWTPKQEQLNNY